jgi:hypothetical protein
MFPSQKIYLPHNTLNFLLGSCPCAHPPFNTLHKLLGKGLSDGVKLIEDGFFEKLGLAGHKLTNLFPFFSDGRDGILQALAASLFVRVLAVHS